MTKLIRAAVFVLVLSVCAQADGIMQNDKTSPPPPPPPATNAMIDTTEPEVDGIMGNDLAAAAQDVALSLLQNFLTLL